MPPNRPPTSRFFGHGTLECFSIIISILVQLSLHSKGNAHVCRDLSTGIFTRRRSFDLKAGCLLPAGCISIPIIFPGCSQTVNAYVWGTLSLCGIMGPSEVKRQEIHGKDELLDNNNC
jgi:hypothetical protein